MILAFTPQQLGQIPARLPAARMIVRGHETDLLIAVKRRIDNGDRYLLADGFGDLAPRWLERGLIRRTADGFSLTASGSWFLGEMLGEVKAVAGQQLSLV